MIAGTGIDIVRNDRIRDSLDRFGERFLRRIYSSREIEYCLSKTDPVPNLAGRFALKEAYIKALNLEGGVYVNFKDIELAGNDFGKKRIHTFGKIAEMERSRQIVRRNFSISHERDYSVAMVILETTDAQRI